MTDKVKIAVDAMSGENSPQKIIEGIYLSLKNNKNNFFYLYGDSDKLNKEITKYKINKEFYEIINTNKIISDEESPLNAAKKGEGTSMWNAIDSQKKKYL